MLLPFVKTTRQNFFSPSLLSLTQCVGRGWNWTPPPPQPQFCYPETATQPPKSGKIPAIPFFFRTSQIFSAPLPPLEFSQIPQILLSLRSSTKSSVRSSLKSFSVRSSPKSSSVCSSLKSSSVVLSFLASYDRSPTWSFLPSPNCLIVLCCWAIERSRINHFPASSRCCFFFFFFFFFFFTVASIVFTTAAYEVSVCVCVCVFAIPKVLP